VQVLTLLSCAIGLLQDYFLRSCRFSNTA